MLLLAAFFATPPPSLRIRADLHHRVFEQHRFSPAGRNDSFGGWIYPGEGRGFAVGTDGRRDRGLFPGWQLRLRAGTAVGTWRPGKNSLAPSHARKGIVARAIFQSSRRQDRFNRAVHRLVSTGGGQSAGRHGENALAHFSFLQPVVCEQKVAGAWFPAIKNPPDNITKAVNRRYLI